MSFRASLKNLIRPDAAASLRERAADLQADLSRIARQSEPQAAPDVVDWDSPPPGFMAYPEREPMSFLNIPEGLRLELERLRNIAEIEFERVTEMAGENLHETMRAGMEDRLRRRLRLDGIEAALAPEMPVSAGVEDRAGLVYYEDAAGKTHRRPVADWIGFTAQRLYTVARQELSRQFNAQCGGLDEAGNRALDAKLRRELRIDALFALTFHSDRAFKAAQDLRIGAEPISAEVRASGDADLIALAPEWEAARDLYAQRIQEQVAVTDAAQPGPSHDQPHAEWARQVAEWRERTGVEAAEAASAEALDELCEIEDRIAELPAASLAGLRLKAFVAQRNDDINVDWPQKLGEGLTRDLLEFTDARAAPPKPAIGIRLVDQIDLASATMDDLRDIQDIAEHVGAVAYAYTWGPRCGTRDPRYGGTTHNEIGKLMHWLGDALTDVETAVDQEVARRVPTNSADRETRLSMLAVATIDNGDSNQIEAFARELLAHVQAEHEDR